MRAVVLLLFFATAFGSAALWQAQRVEALKRERELAADIQQGKVGESPSGLIEAGWGVVVIGTPSGLPVVGAPSGVPVVDAPSGVSVIDAQSGVPVIDAQSRAEPAPLAEAPRAPEAPQVAPPARGDAQLADFELVVESGQTLSKIAKAHYGTAARDVVRALARYNGLADENALKLGQPLKLPALDRLQR
jgi:hypothetical protein